MHTPTNLDLNSIDAVILDMDGVMWRGTEILPGVPDFFLFLCERHIPYAMATNNATRSAMDYVSRIGSLGVPIRPEQIITSALVTAEELGRSYPPGTPIYVVGSPRLIELLVERGYDIDPENAKVVVAGLDVTLTYDKLRIAGQRILAGAEFIGTNGDRTLPTADGLMPGAGTIIAALQAMTDRKPRLMGKPEPAMFHTALRHLGTPPERTFMIGDRLDTDIDGAQRAGLRTALVLTGVSQRTYIGEIVPDGIYESLADLHKAWRGN